ncbi:hypothetical protein QQ045_014328 [Rhodiola kirilowii]
MQADSPHRKRYSRSPPPRRGRSRSRSPSRSRDRTDSRARQNNVSRSRSRSRSRGRTTEVVNPGNTLYVTGLSTRVTERQLEEHFSKEGKVASCFLVMEPRTRISRGFAFITMDSVEDANRCIKHVNQSVLEGRYITVEKVIGLRGLAANYFYFLYIFLTWEFPGYIQNILHQLCWQQSKIGSVIPTY